MAVFDRQKTTGAYGSLFGVFALTIGLVSFYGCDSDPDTDPARDGNPATSAEIEALRPQITAFCGGCHAVPDPATFPKNSWHHEVEKAYGFFRASDRKDLTAPTMTTVVRWFREQAPDSLVLSPSKGTTSPIPFRHEPIPYDAPGGAPSISGVFFQTGSGFDATTASPHTSALFCDMGNGILGEALAGKNVRISVKTLPGLEHPARITKTDLDGNGSPDYVISELGSYLPEDHNHGQVLWYRPDAEEAQQVSVLLADVGRVTDAQPGDFDGDGDLDLIVAEFGWIKTGRIHLLKQTGKVDGVPQFESSVIDTRHGTIHVPVADLDNDGDLDFVALISQEHEEVAAFLNRGDGSFERQLIHPGSEPAFGSSGIELVDLDGDGDLDVLYVNGDSLDSQLIKPYHGVRWLENTGDFPFERHLIGLIPGACRAVSGDLDNDGDRDIVVGAWIPPENPVTSPDKDGKFDTLLWFEQTAVGEFRRHSIERNTRYGFMSADLGDLDGDSDLDIVAGHFGVQTDFDVDAQTVRKIDVFWNMGESRQPTSK